MNSKSTERINSNGKGNSARRFSKGEGVREKESQPNQETSISFYLSAFDICTRLNVSKSFFFEHVRKHLHPILIGRNVRFEESDVQKYIESRRL